MGRPIKLDDRTLKAILDFSKRIITRTEYERIVKSSEYVREYSVVNKIPLITVTSWLYYYIPELYEKGEYETEVKWYKVLATKSYIYPKQKRHIECRLLTEAPENIANTAEFNDFCSDLMDMFLECMGYIPFVDFSERYYHGIQIIDEFYDVLERKVPFYIEIFDANYNRYPFYAEGYFSPKYWEDYVKAKVEFEEQACTESVLSAPYKYESGIEFRQRELGEWEHESK